MLRPSDFGAIQDEVELQIRCWQLVRVVPTKGRMVSITQGARWAHGPICGRRIKVARWKLKFLRCRGARFVWNRWTVLTSRDWLLQRQVTLRCISGVPFRKVRQPLPIM
jgi:hypothetical protein